MIEVQAHPAKTFFRPTRKITKELKTKGWRYALSGECLPNKQEVLSSNCRGVGGREREKEGEGGKERGRGRERERKKKRKKEKKERKEGRKKANTLGKKFE
jgi:hypothetical protein